MSGQRLAVNDMTDAQIDAHFPRAVRRASSKYWTRVNIARKAAQLFERHGIRRVLDMGSGPGKFCVIAAARAPAIEFLGIEHRPHLVTVAQTLAASLDVANATFVAGDATSMPWTGIDGIYAYNSFAENDFHAFVQFDRTVELSRGRHIAEAKRVAARLAVAPVGTVVITHHGLSGPIPGSYELVHVEAAGTGWLRVWRKGAVEVSGRYWLEAGSEVDVLAAPSQ